jgi:hypothetical protein
MNAPKLLGTDIIGPVGRSWQMQYDVSGAARMHAVFSNGVTWQLRCTGSRGTHEYEGTFAAVTCPQCRKILEKEA